MALPRDFMARVVAWPGDQEPGYVNLHLHRPLWKDPTKKIMLGWPFRSLDEFMYLAQQKCNEGDVYFCLSTQSAVGKNKAGYTVAVRQAPNALMLKAIWLDVDVGKPQVNGKDVSYATLQDAEAAIDTFYQAANLPPPSATVRSGGGLHVYWISDRPLTVEQWRPYARGLRALAEQHSIRCDAGLTEDRVRILRVPGTFNYKQSQPRPVTLGVLGNDYDFASALALLPTLTPVTATVTAPLPAGMLPPGFGAPSSLMSLLSAHPDNHALGERREAAARVVGPGIMRCQHFKETFTNQGAGQANPLWNLNVLAATWFENGEKVAHALSKGHKDYSKDETSEKYHTKLRERENNPGIGWTKCTTFEANGANCKGCPFYGQPNFRPLKLAEPPEPPPKAAASFSPQVAAAEADLHLPNGYELDGENYISLRDEFTDKKGDTHTRFIRVFLNRVRNVSLRKSPIGFQMDVENGVDGWTNITLPIGEALSGDVVKLLAMRGLLINPELKQRQTFMSNWMKTLNDAIHRVNVAPFGWATDVSGGKPVGFSYGGKLFRLNDTTIDAAPPDNEVAKNYTPRGTPEPWFKAVDMIVNQPYSIPLQVVIGLSFGAPLTAALGLYNAFLHVKSSESAAHKSTAIHTATAVWGNPQTCKERTNTSEKGLFKKLGTLNNLPVFLDEISDTTKMDELVKLVGPVTEGAFGNRLKSNREFFEQEVWQTLVCVGANKSLIDAAKQAGTGTDAQLQRIFEIEAIKVPAAMNNMDETDATQLIGSLDNNFGWAGLRYAEYLGHNIPEVFARVTAAAKEITAVQGKDDAARFRRLIAACSLVGAELANEVLGTKLDTVGMKQFLYDELKKQTVMIAQANMVTGSLDHTKELLSEFFKANTKKTLMVNNQNNSPTNQGPPMMVYVSGPTAQRPEQVNVRGTINRREIEISRKALRFYFKEHEIEGAPVEACLAKDFGATVIRNRNLCAGILPGPREDVFLIPVPVGSPLDGILFGSGNVTAAVTTGLSANTGPHPSPSVPPGATGGNQP